MYVMQYAGAEVTGGLLAHVEILTKGLVAAEHRAHVVLSPALGADRTASACAAAGATVSRQSVAGKTDLAGMMRLSALVAREAPDLLHLHLSSPVEALPALLAARLGRARKILTTEHAPTWFPRSRFYSRTAKKAATRSLAAVIALCESDARFLEERFEVPADLITVIPNGVPGVDGVISRAEARERLGLPAAADPLVGYVGALETKKGIWDLLDAATSAGIPDLAVALAGEGSLRRELSARADALPFALALTGQIQDVGTFLAALDLFVFPSHQEAMPLALLEAMHAGLPIIASRVGGIPEALEDGRGGLLIDPARPDQIAAALGRLAQDRELSASLGAAARKIALARFTAAGMVRRTVELYAAILAGETLDPRQARSGYSQSRGR